MALARNICVVGILALGLAGCFRPLYGSQEFGGLAAQQGLSGISIELNGDRLAHYIRNELEYELRGGTPGQVAVTHKLVVNARQTTSTASFDRVFGTADSAAVTLNATYTLTAVGSSAALTTGEAVAVVSYERSLQRFANTRAARDAEIRGAKQVAEQIKTRIASYLASRR